MCTWLLENMSIVLFGTSSGPDTRDIYGNHLRVLSCSNIIDVYTSHLNNVCSYNKERKVLFFSFLKSNLYLEGLAIFFS